MSSSTSSHSFSATTHQSSGSLAAPASAASSTTIPSVVFTTIYPYGTPTPMPAPSHHSTSLPIASIAGGAAAGVVLAIAAVIGWSCWGRNIKRKEKRKRDEELAAIQVRENTRRNASTGAAFTSYTPAFSARAEDRKVTFVPPTPSMTGTTAQSASKEKEKPKTQEKVSSEVKPVPPSSRPLPTPATKTPSTRTPSARTPSTRTPFIYRNLEPVDNLTPPPRPKRSRLRRSQQDVQIPPQTHDIPSLAHQSSTMSSESVYSTQSGEERQRRVRSSLIMAALGHAEGRRSWFSNYFSLPTPQADGVTGEQTRISQVSSMSAYSQPDSPVGYAISGDDGPPFARAV